MGVRAVVIMVLAVSSLCFAQATDRPSGPVVTDGGLFPEAGTRPGAPDAPGTPVKPDIAIKPAVQPGSRRVVRVAPVTMRPASQIVTDERVVEAMKRVDYLVKQKKVDNWEGDLGKNKQFTGGETALALYALLAARESLHNDDAYQKLLDPYGPELAPVVQWLEKQPVEGTYSAGYRSAALALIPERADGKADEALKAALQLCKDYLAMAIGPDGGYSYVKIVSSPVDNNQRILSEKRNYDDVVKRVQTGQVDPLTGKKVPYSKEEAARLVQEAKAKVTKAELRFNPIGDTSNAQCGTMGAAALVDCGVDMPKRYWEVTDRFWRMSQKDDGSWPYYIAGGDQEGSVAMGVAGVASLLTASRYLETTPTLTAKSDKNLESGLTWLKTQFKLDVKNGYCMACLVRVAGPSGLKYIGTHDWYKECAEYLVQTQHPDGGVFGSFSGYSSTSFAILFLAKGRHPVLISKLDYGAGSNLHAGDAMNAAQWAGKKSSRPLGWQEVDLKMSAEDWADAPVLLISGSGDPKFTKEDLEKMRAFVEAGGTIFSTADNSSLAFSNAVKKYAPEATGDKAQFRPLPKDHPFFKKESGLDLSSAPGLLGVSNGEREVWIHCSGDVGAMWQQRNGKTMDLAAALYYYVKDSPLMRNRLAQAKTGAAGTR